MDFLKNIGQTTLNFQKGKKGELLACAGIHELSVSYPNLFQCLIVYIF